MRIVNKKTGARGVVPALAFIPIGEGEVCDCVDKETCPCVYEDLKQSLVSWQGEEWSVKCTKL